MVYKRKKNASKRYVYGTATKKWYLVGKKDRDYTSGITPTRMKRIGKRRARREYLMGRFI